MANFTNAQLAQKLADLIAYWSSFNEEYANWLGGAVDGGPSSDGLFPLTDYTGDESLVACPALLSDDVSGYVAIVAASAAAALASENAAGTSESNATAQAAIATAQAVLADADRIAAAAAESGAVDAKVTAIAQAAVATAAAAVATAIAEGSVPSASQAEAEAGTEVDDRLFSPFRVSQAIASLAGGDPKRNYPTLSPANLTGVGYHVVGTGAIISAASAGTVTVKGRYFNSQNSAAAARMGDWEVNCRILAVGEPDNGNAYFTGDYFQSGIRTQMVRIARKDDDGTLVLFFGDLGDLSQNMQYAIDEVILSTETNLTWDDTLCFLDVLTDQVGYSDNDTCNTEALSVFAGMQIGAENFDGETIAFGISNTNNGGSANSVSFFMQATAGFEELGALMNEGVKFSVEMNNTNLTQDLVISLPTAADGSNPTERYRFSDDYFSTALGIQAGTLELAGDLTLVDANPSFFFQETDQPLDEKNWIFKATGGNFKISTATDAAPTVSAVDIFQISRTGTAGALFSLLDLTGMKLRDGAYLRIMDPGDTDWMSFSHDGTNFNMSATNIGWLQMLSLDDGLWLRDGAKFRISDADDTDYMDMWHNGTAFYYSYLNTLNVYNHGGRTYHFNTQENATTTLNIGEGTTTRGGSQSSAVEMFGETVGVIYSGAMGVRARRMFFEGSASGAQVDVEGFDINLDLAVSGALDVVGAVTGSNLAVANWDTAYGWGDHATFGYGDGDAGLDYDEIVTGNWSFTHASGILIGAAPVTAALIANWNTAFGWGNHASGGYLTDAPSDGSQYSRKDGAWDVITPGGGSGDTVNLTDENIAGQWRFSHADVAPATATSSLTSTFLYLNGLAAVDGGDTWLRLNPSGSFTAGVYIPGHLRVDTNILSYGTITIGDTSNLIGGGGDITGFGQITLSEPASGTNNSINLLGTGPSIYFSETDQTTDEKGYKMYVSGSNFNFYTTSDAGAASQKIFAVERGAGTAVGVIQFDVDMNIAGANSLTVGDLGVPHHVSTGYIGGKITVASSAPSTPAKGDIWYDTT